MKLERGKTYHTSSKIFTVLDISLQGRPETLIVKYKSKSDHPNYKEFVVGFDPYKQEEQFFFAEPVLGEYKEPRSQSLNLYLYEWPDKSWRLSTIRLTDDNCAKMLATKKVTITEGEGMQYA